MLEELLKKSQSLSSSEIEEQPDFASSFEDKELFNDDDSLYFYEEAETLFSLQEIAW